MYVFRHVNGEINYVWHNTKIDTFDQKKMFIHISSSNSTKCDILNGKQRFFIFIFIFFY